MTYQDVVDQVVAATLTAIADGTLSTYTPVESVAAILGLDAFESVVPAE
jgi:hypothetical protein